MSKPLIQAGPATRWSGDEMKRRVARRYAAERRFRALGLAAVLLSLAFLAFLLVTMIVRGAGGFSSTFLTASDATDPAMAGVWGALKGSMLTILVTMALAFPIGVLAAVYLEEFARRNRWNDLVEVSINNLAAVPSIIFGLLGLAVFLKVMNLPRSAPLVGGLTLALMTMPVIVIAGRNAIKAVPPSIRDAALGVGASKMQVVFHHVLPLALPGILTGTIIGMARALGETAPLLMIGMRAFIAAPPAGVTSPATVLPVQIFLWSDEVDRAFVEKTSAAIIVLLVFMLMMNGLAIYLRNKFERRW
ncbi:phosphate ABC transporter permease PstA [Sphingomonas arvum]|nr:phosphate ABC transporter permease PstA [Sphingomonas sp. BN140010]